MNLDRSEVVPIRTQQVPQNIETPVTFSAVPNAYIRYAYARSSESMQAQGEGQDYLCFKHNDQRLVFVVCDGVGSSFCGNLAARILGENLMDWLWSLDIEYLGGEAALVESATAYLNNKLQKQAQHEVEEYKIPGSDQMNALILQALEAQRSYGSEAIFAAGRIDHPGPMMTDGLISLIWMGDTQIHLYDAEENEIDLGAVWTSANRFSTVQGTKGEMNGWMQPLSNISRVTVFSDGLTAHVDRVAGYSDSTLDREIHAGARLATSDDVSFIDVVLRSTRYEGYPDPDLPDPNMERPHLQQIWNPTGDDKYEVRWNWPSGQKAAFLLQEAQNPALTDARIIEIPQDELNWKPGEAHEPGAYYYRVRAIPRRGPLTPWSELRRTKVNYPPPNAPTLDVDDENASNPTLVWSEEGEALDYTLERSASEDFAEVEIMYEGRGTNWTPPGKITPGTFYYRVRAISDGGPGAYSATQRVEVTLPPPPVPSLGLAGMGGKSGYELRWQSTPGSVYYEVEWVEQESEETESARTQDTIFFVGGEKPGHYVYRVRACHDYGCSDWSNEQEIVVTPPPPKDTPELSVAGPDEVGNITLTWNEIEGAAEYSVEMSGETSIANAQVYTTTDTSLELPRKEPGLLTARVRASNKGGDGPWSDSVNHEIKPHTPAWIEAHSDETSGEIEMAWASVGGRVEYVLQMADDKGGHPLYRGTETQFKIKASDIAGSNARFRVCAAAQGEVKSDWQTSDVLVVVGAVDIPDVAVPRLDIQGQVIITWEAVPSAEHYELDIARDSGFTQTQAAKRVSETQATFHPISTGEYWFRVRAIIDGRPGPTSKSVSITIDQSPAPHLWQPNFAGKEGPFEITWRGVPGSEYYEFHESRMVTFDAEVTSVAKIYHPSQKVALPLEKRQESVLYYRVRSVDKNGIAGPWSNVIRIEV